MASVTRQLVANPTTSGTWTQMTEGAGGTAYTVPTSGRATTRLLSVLNNDLDPGTMEFAISADSTITFAEKILQPILLGASWYAESDDVHVLREGEGIWVRVTGSLPNATFRASILEVT